MRQACMYTPHQIRRIAVAAQVDPRTVEAYLCGKRKRRSIAIECLIKAAIERLKLEGTKE